MNLEGLGAHPLQPLIDYDNSLHASTHGMPLQHLDPNAHNSFSAQPPPQSSIANASVDDKKKKASGGGNATNDKELREMLVRNEGRKLKDVAAEVIATDRTSKAEKSKQLFAMLWLKAVCKQSSASTPRNRVYSKYAERCGTDRVIPLNPASFGKLVRVIFPGIQTRRLGVRGESKYHYVDMELIEDATSQAQRPTSQSSRRDSRRQGSIAPPLDFGAVPMSQMPADTASFPPQEALPQNLGYFSSTASRGRIFTDIYSPQFRPENARSSTTYEYELKFPSQELLASEDSLDITLPRIDQWLPTPAPDPDAVEALVALYRTHCTSVIDSVRYCKEKQFYRLFGSFHGTLTVPVQKLFAMPRIAGWIKECDYMMYQKIIRNVRMLTLQVAPPPVLKFLDNICKMLHAHLGKVFQGLPGHVLEAKLEPATVFVHLLRQMLRVNSTAHAAAVMLTVDDHRDRMWADWQAYVNIKRVVENELPQSCAHEDVHNILATEIRGLLVPLKSEMWLPDGSYYQAPQPDPSVDLTQETVIDRIAAFLTRLPYRFPQVSARSMLHIINAVGSAALREITVENGPSFQGWWLTKVFVDEYAQWLASLGGFLFHEPPSDPNSPSFSPDGMASIHAGTNGGSHANSRFSSEDADQSMAMAFDAAQSFVSNGASMLDSSMVNTQSKILISTGS